MSNHDFLGFISVFVVISCNDKNIRHIEDFYKIYLKNQKRSIKINNLENMDKIIMQLKKTIVSKALENIRKHIDIEKIVEFDYKPILKHLSII